MPAEKIIAIGASTGGVEALAQVLGRFSANVPPIVLTIHMPHGITRIYANQLDDTLNLSAKEAEAGDYLKPGQVLVAPSGKHMTVVKRGGRWAVDCFVGEKVQYAIPSVDVLFESVAREVKQNAVGVLLTGIGADGARGLLQMRQSGAVTIGQNEETCVVYGMPKVAKEMDAVCHELPLEEIAHKILSLV